MTDSSAHPLPSPVTVLAFDTSTASLSAAVVRNGVVAGAIQSFAERNHSVLIMPAIKRLLAESGLNAGDIDAIAVGRGPGSYTGVRIAVTVGKTLAWTWNKTLLGISSLEALAFGARESTYALNGQTAGTVWLVPVMDARRGQVFTARFLANEQGRWERAQSDGIRPAADWAEALRIEAERTRGLSEIWFVGETSIHEAVFDAVQTESIPVRMLPFAMDAGAVGRLASVRFARGEKDDIHSFVPNYTQMAEAEAKWLAAARRD